MKEKLMDYAFRAGRCGDSMEQFGDMSIQVGRSKSSVERKDLSNPQITKAMKINEANAGFCALVVTLRNMVLPLGTDHPGFHKRYGAISAVLDNKNITAVTMAAIDESQDMQKSASKFPDEQWDPMFTVSLAQKNHHPQQFQTKGPANVPPGELLQME
uniref:Uncharacterized protein n=1 Tax=Brassica campestris TaxID=3711 RepID=M4EU91_BRACM